MNIEDFCPSANHQILINLKQTWSVSPFLNLLVVDLMCDIASSPFILNPCLGIEFSLPLVEERRKSREQQNLTVYQGEEEQKEKAQKAQE